MRVVVIIPARGGSKGIPGKNAKPLAGKPLISHSIEHAKNSKLVTKIFVTTDCQNIKKIALDAGVGVIDRPAKLSGDSCSSESALAHALDQIMVNSESFDYVVFLQCTSPFRRINDIDDAINKIRKEQADSLLSVVQSHKFLWSESQSGAKSINYDFQNRPRRQDMPIQFQENGSIYIFKPWVLEDLNNRLGG